MPRESMKGKFLKPDETMHARLAKAAAGHDGVEKKMFGTSSWFTPVTAQVFICLWGADVAVRVGEAEAQKLIKSGKVKPFEPMPGHTMKEYVFLPAADARDDRKLSAWIERSAGYAMRLPPKKK